MSCDNSKFNYKHTKLQDKYSTTLLEELTSWDVVSVTFSFLATHFRATLRCFLSSAGRLASKLVGGSSTRGYGVVQVD
jgi:CRISPR/Cas system CSM-associated protein Csm3 (group 7 of RAMP superfamily)